MASGSVSVTPSVPALVAAVGLGVTPIGPEVATIRAGVTTIRSEILAVRVRVFSVVFEVLTFALDVLLVLRAVLLIRLQLERLRAAPLDGLGVNVRPPPPSRPYLVRDSRCTAIAAMPRKISYPGPIRGD